MKNLLKHSKLKIMRSIFILFLSLTTFSASAQSYQLQTDTLFDDSCCLAIKVIESNSTAHDWTVDIIDEATGTIILTLTHVDFDSSGITFTTQLCNLPAGTYTTSLYPNTIPSGSTIYPINQTLPFCQVEDCPGVDPEFNFMVNCLDLTTTDLSTNSSNGNFTHIEWYIDGVLIGADVPGGALIHTLSPGTHTVCLKMFVFDNGVCCHKEICKTVTVEPCDDLEALFSEVNTACTIEFTNESTLGCGTLNTVNWHIDGVLVQSQVNQFVHEFDDTDDHTVCIEVITTLDDGSICSKNFCKTVSVVADCNDIRTKMILSNPQPCPTGSGDCCITAEHISTSNATTVDWIWGDGSSSTGNTATHTYSSNGVYQVTMVATYSPTCDSTLCCVQTKTQTVTITNCVSNNNPPVKNNLKQTKFKESENNQLVVFPNSINKGETLNLELLNKKDFIKEVKFYDLNARLILKKTFNIGEACMLKMNMIESSGVYLLKALDDKDVKYESKIFIR